MVLDEIYLLIKHSNFSYSDLEKIATYKRRYFLNRLKEDIERIEEENNNISRNFKKR